MPKPIFSQQLEEWLRTGDDKTLAGLNELFGEKSFALIFLLMMALPALPIPTGGITHVLEVIVMLLCVELIIGRRTVWLPKKWLKLNASKLIKGRGLKKLIAFIKWFERFSRQRLHRALKHSWTLALLGLIILVFTVAAFLAPPFSGLDTLPSLGVVIISLALILEDAAILLVGLLVGIAGIGLEIGAGTAIYSGLRHIFG